MRRHRKALILNLSARTTSHIVVSTLQETHVLRFEGDQGTMVSNVGGSDKGFLSSRTLAVSNIQRRIPGTPGTPSAYVDSSLVVQVVPEGLLLLDYDFSLREYTRIGDLWTLDKFSDGNTASWANREIVAADINPSQVVIALNHGRLVQLILDGDKFVRKRMREFVEPAPLNCTAEISAVTCLPLDSTKSYAVNIAVGFWMSKVVKILSLLDPFTIKDVCETSELPAAPRSLLLYSFTSETGGKLPPLHPHLLVGLVDGSLAAFPFQNGTLGDQKLISIGNLPVTMHTCRIRGRSTVFACGSRTSILFWEKDRLQHSPLMLKVRIMASSCNLA
jgi:DNA damage-binding protein 1